ncbi:GNAT family N-acetyltransferase [Saccharopolyspora sp. K220]|uniref:GNAT family N-acetyltransferase n=1 Tax=Saccharopolyspora soli TaxID=2926618 RepID=UPI001F5AEA8D|nr:GNAT family N-acetyltransferase [Saccharopolyspora soli]MCI2418837.1 GNAT family N-acetyltransferase [Saccharopolyspora soli]
MGAIRPQVIRTERLGLVPLRVDHAAEMANVLADPELYTFIGGAPLSARTLRTRYERIIAGAPDPAVSWCNWVVRLLDEARLVGTVQATISPSDRGPIAEIAWIVGTAWQRRGIAKEAARGLVDWLRRQPVRDVVAHIHPDHRASAAVATATGFKPTGQWQNGELNWRLTISPNRTP